jgi:uncharacterized coiled-coil protein SlyX
MSRCISLRLALAALIAAAFIPLAARAQSQDSQTQSVADAARRAREQKKAADKQPSPVITNDTLKPAAPVAPTTEAPAPPPALTQSPDAAPAPPSAPSAQSPADSSSAADAQALGAPASPAAEADPKSKDSAEVAAQKHQLADAQKELDLLQRELTLEQDNVYSKPNSASDTAGKAKLDDITQQLAGKQQAVEALKARLEALLESAGAAAPAKPPAPPQP